MGLDLIAVGCSWGGLAALERLLDALPSALDAPIVIVQHRPEAPSGLAELLSHHTARTVREVQDKDTITRGAVYVAPSGYHLLVDRTGFSLTTEAPIRHSRPSVDVLFESAARAFGEGLAAVILTGANDDGAAGLQRVAELGGVALVQEPGSAERGAMPAAAFEAVPDAFVGTIEDIAAVLVEVAAEVRS